MRIPHRPATTEGEVHVQKTFAERVRHWLSIGLAISSPSYAARMMQMDDDAPVGGGGGGDDPVLVETPGGGSGGSGSQLGIGDYTAMRNEMQSVLFGDGTTYSLGYSLDSFPTTGSVLVVSNDYQLFTLTVLEVRPLPNVAAQATLLPEAQNADISSFEVASIIGQAMGPTANVYTVQAFVFSCQYSTGDQVIRIVPYRKILSYPEMEETFRYTHSTPGSIVAGSPDMARNPDSGTVCGSLSTEKERCICYAQAQYDICSAQVTQAYRLCYERAGLQFIKAWLGCLGRIAFGGPVGLVLLFTCGYYLLDSIKKYMECEEDMRLAMSGCYQSFRLSMEQCGVLILELR